MRIFLGFSEVANFINTYRKGFELNGYETFTVISRRNKYYPNAHYDVVLEDYARFNHKLPKIITRIFRSILIRYYSYKTFLYVLSTCDIFIYNTGGNILPYRLDYKLIKLFKKKLVIIFLGSEIRHWYVYKLEMENLGYAKLFESGIEAYRLQNYGTYKEKLNRVRYAERYADIIFSHPSFAQLQVKPYMRGFIGLEIEKYICEIPLNKIPVIIHAPTHRGVKGTEYVVKVINELKCKGYNLIFHLVEGLANDQLLELLTKADIVIDELNSDSIGVLSTEAMATGNVVLTSYLLEHFVDSSSSPPVLNTNKDNLYSNLEMVITNLSLRYEIARKGRDYVEKNNNLASITDNIIKQLSIDPDLRTYDIYPNPVSRFTIPKDISCI